MSWIWSWKFKLDVPPHDRQVLFLGTPKATTSRSSDSESLRGVCQASLYSRDLERQDGNEPQDVAISLCSRRPTSLSRCCPAAPMDNCVAGDTLVDNHILKALGLMFILLFHKCWIKSFPSLTVVQLNVPDAFPYLFTPFFTHGIHPSGIPSNPPAWASQPK